MKVAILGAGGHGRVLMDIASEMGMEIIGFFDDDAALRGKRIDGAVVLGHSGLIETLPAEGTGLLLGIGDNAIRSRFFGSAKNLGVRILSAFHPRSVVSKKVESGEGVVVMPGTVINAGSRLGDNVCVNTAASLDHDCVLEDHVHVYPGACLAGGVRVRRFAYISTGAVVAPYVTIGENATVGAGAVVLEDVPDNALVVGAPARVVKSKDQGRIGKLT